MRISRYTDFAHTGPGTLAGRYLRGYWQPVYRVHDLPAGRAVPIRLMSEDLTFYRGESGQPHLVASRCAHRGTQLSTGWVEGDAIRCFYHGWKYDGAGQCLEQPAEPQPFCAKVRLRSYPVQEYLDLIFAYLGEGEPPPLPRFPYFEQPGVLVAGTVQLWACNYFQAVENHVDQTHLSFVHRTSSFSAGCLVDIPVLSYKESDYGITVRGTRPGGVVRLNHCYMPNANHVKQPIDDSNRGWMDLLVFKTPVDDEHHLLFVNWFVPLPAEASGEGRADLRARLVAESEKYTRLSMKEAGEAVLSGARQIDDFDVQSNVKINLQDYVAQVGQGRIVDREHEQLGRGDVGIILLRKIWARELRALAEGRPLTKWTRPEGLISTTGVGD